MTQQQRWRAERAECRAKDKALFSGPVEIGPEMRALIDSGKPVKSKMTRRALLRATIQGDLVGYGSGLIIVIYDPRAQQTGRESADIIQQGNGDYRVAIRRSSPMDTREAKPLEIDTGARSWECYSAACSRLIKESK
jgi:hypothetical protein